MDDTILGRKLVGTGRFELPIDECLQQRVDIDPVSSRLEMSPDLEPVTIPD